ALAVKTEGRSRSKLDGHCSVLQIERVAPALWRHRTFDDLAVARRQKQRAGHAHVDAAFGLVFVLCARLGHLRLGWIDLDAGVCPAKNEEGGPAKCGRNDLPPLDFFHPPPPCPSPPLRPPCRRTRTLACSAWATKPSSIQSREQYSPIIADAWSVITF